MTLGVHAFVGAAVGRLTGNPFLAFIAGFVSHLVIDVIPHKDYGDKLHSLKIHKDAMDDDFVLGRKSVRDLAILGFDSLLGLLAALAVFRSTPELAVIAGIGGLLPDFLHFVYFKLRTEPLTTFERFHVAIQHHTKGAWFGRLTQAATVIAAAALSLSRLP